MNKIHSVCMAEVHYDESLALRQALKEAQARIRKLTGQLRRIKCQAKLTTKAC